MVYTYTDRNGKVIRERRAVRQAQKRLAYLDAVEVETQRVMPTDSGDMRFLNRAEAAAIRAALWDETAANEVRALIRS